MRNRILSFIAILALTLGIGATTVMFSVIYSVVVDALPYKNFDRSVVFKIQNLANAGGWKGRDFFLPDETRAFREQNHVFEETIGYNGIRLQYDDGRSVRYWPRGETVTANTFDFLGVSPLLGRTFSQEDGRLDAPSVFVMNYHFWQSEFGGDPKILTLSSSSTANPQLWSESCLSGSTRLRLTSGCPCVMRETFLQLWGALNRE
jgi:putative ABC transport system permease protein